MMPAPTIGPAVQGDLETIKTIAVYAEMFTAEGVEFFDEIFAGAWLR